LAKPNLNPYPAPFELNPTALYRESLLSSGTITNRINRVEAEGLVKRSLTVYRLSASSRLAWSTEVVHTA